MQRFLLFAFSTLAIMGLTAPLAPAAPVTYQFTGHVTSQRQDSGAPYGSASDFHGSFTFDSSWVDDLGSDPTRGFYSGFGAPYGVTLGLGGGTFRFDGSLEVTKFDGSPDGLRVQFRMAVGDPGATFTSGSTTIPVDVIVFSMEFVDSTGTAFSSDALLPLAPFSAFDSTGFDFLVGLSARNDSALYRGVLDSLAPTLTDATPQVPVPAALPLFLTGLGGMGLFARWRKRKVAAAVAR
jgi:hypothetical protein